MRERCCAGRALVFEPLLCLMVLLPTGSALKYALLGFAVLFHLGA